MKIIDTIFEIIGWLQIVLGATLAAGIIAFVTYLNWSTKTGKIVAIIIISLGFILGIIWATRIWKKHGTIAWLSIINRIT